MWLRPEWHTPLRDVHIHINLYGFVGLTAIGTLQVLFPTAANRADPRAALRLKNDLDAAVLGSVLLAIGAAGYDGLDVAGLLFWLWPIGRLAYAWLKDYRAELFALHRCEPVLLAALAGFTLSLLATLDAHATISPLAVFLPGFLFPLLTGAAAQLAPVWIGKNPNSQQISAARAQLNRHGGARAILFVLAAILIHLGQDWALLISLVGLSWFVLLFIRWRIGDDGAKTPP
jgi:hypothetical protein